MADFASDEMESSNSYQDFRSAHLPAPYPSIGSRAFGANKPPARGAQGTSRGAGWSRGRAAFSNSTRGSHSAREGHSARGSNHSARGHSARGGQSARDGHSAHRGHSTRGGQSHPAWLAPPGSFKPRPFPGPVAPQHAHAAVKRPAAAPATGRFQPPAKVRLEQKNRQNFVLPADAPDNFKQLVENQQCILCSASVNSIVSAEVHYNGKAHQKQLRENGLQAGEYFSGVLSLAAVAPGSQGAPKSFELPDGMDSRYCKLCDVTFTNTIQMFQHYSGRKHQNNAKDGRKLAQALTVNTKVFRCDICDIFTNTQESMDAHLSGMKHQANVTAQTGGADCGSAPAHAPAASSGPSAPPAAGPPAPPAAGPSAPPAAAAVPARATNAARLAKEWPFKCSVCAMTFDCQDAQSAHMMSRLHNDRLVSSEAIATFVSGVRGGGNVVAPAKRF